ncbi:MAG: ParB N-terminal domain-containing protein [Gammaproteobacteria bacterium]
MSVFDMAVHPAADVFPMLPDDELNDLAEDIKQNGLQQPIVFADLNGYPVLIDGRNRREACKRAGVDPKVVVLKGQDPITYILSANVNRRHLSKGQRAMAVAKVWSVSDQTSRKLSDQSGVSKTRLIEARAVLIQAPELADQVLSGALSLDAAYDEAKKRKNAAASAEERFEALRREAPDIADLVTEERMTLAEGEVTGLERHLIIERQRRLRLRLGCLLALALLGLAATVAHFVDAQDLLRRHAQAVLLDAIVARLTGELGASGHGHRITLLQLAELIAGLAEGDHAQQRPILGAVGGDGK